MNFAGFLNKISKTNPLIDEISDLDQICSCNTKYNKERTRIELFKSLSINFQFFD